MALAIFDLDETLINGDCATLWSERMCSLGWVDRASFMRENDALMSAYSEGKLAMEDYMAFSLAPLKGRAGSAVALLVDVFVRSHRAAHLRRCAPYRRPAPHAGRQASGDLSFR